MAILMNLALAGLLLSLRDTQAKNIQAALNADIAGDVNQESLLVFETSQGSSTTLNFDDVPTDIITGTGTISTYSYMNFSGFTTVNTIAAASLGSISIHDADCASSQPNALFSAGAWVGHEARSRWVADTTKLHSAGHSEFFNLNGLRIKPLGEVPHGLILEIVAWEIRDSEAQNVYNTWIAYTKEGYQEMEYYDLTMFGGSWGQKVNMVEIVIRAPDENQEEVHWAFCLDDLDIEFLDRRLNE